MASTSSAPSPDSGASVEAVSSGLDRAINLTVRLATSWVGIFTGYVGAVSVAVIAFQKLAEPLKQMPLWMRGLLVGSLPFAALVSHTIPAMIDRSRKNRLSEIGGHLQPGYFRLSPRDEESSFTRVDGMHQEVLQWVERYEHRVLYLTGLSGSGKSSLLAAWVLPNLARKATLTISLRGYQDPVAALEQELRSSGVIWQKPSLEAADVRSLIERACRYLQPRRLLIVLDQFEEFLILQSPDQQRRLEQLFSSLQSQPVEGVTFLIVLRSDYIGLIDRLAIPPLAQGTNWKEVSPFTEAAARDFVKGSGLQFSEDLLRRVLREAAEIEQTKGLIRPVTINLCGLVLGRFATGLPRGYQPGHLIRGFLRESVLLPLVRDTAPKLIPQLTTSYVTKRPRTITDLAQASALDPAEVRGCLRVLGQTDRAIVHPLDTEQQTWEISHDFLVPLLDSIVSRWKTPFWRRFRFWAPWLATCSLVLAVGLWGSAKDPIAGLTGLGWSVEEKNDALILALDGPPPRESLEFMARTRKRLRVRLSAVDGITSTWSNLKNLTALTLGGNHVSDVSALKDLKSLTTLDLFGTQVSDVSALKDLTNLTTLNLADTRVADVSALKGLTSLTELNLTGTRVVDVSALKGLTNLTELNLTGTRVSDVSALENLTKLTKLGLYGTQVVDVRALKGLKNLTTLNLGNTLVVDMSALKDLTKLTELDLQRTRVSRVSALKDLVSLAKLDLEYTKVSDVSALKDLTNLTELKLSGTKVSGVSALKDLTNLTTLYLSDTPVSDVSALKGLKKLTNLSLILVKVSDVSTLKDLTNLTTLHLEGTRVADASALKELTKLTELNLSNTKVSDVSALKDLTNLTTLDLSDTKVSDVSALKDLTNLTELKLSGTKVSDLSALKDLTNLTRLNLSGTNVSELSALRDLAKLTELSLDGTKVYDVSALRDLRELSELSLSGTKVTDVSALKGLPNLTIVGP